MAFKTLSWGCGLQSTTIAAMSALGDLPKLDAIITADTGWERQATYDMRDWYIEWLQGHDMHVEVVYGGNIKTDGMNPHIHIPFWTADGGPLRRQCTDHFKIRPVRKRTRELIGYHASNPPHPPPGNVETWLGISLDEWTRMRTSPVKFIVHCYPLVDLGMTRNDCADYLSLHGLPEPPKSACIGCPYRRASEWIDIRDNAPDEWEDAIEFDEANRNNPLAERDGSTADEIFIWKHGPLAAADLESYAAREIHGKQLPLLCESGYCMV